MKKKMISVLLASALAMGSLTGVTVLADNEKDEVTKLTAFVNATWYWTDQWNGIIPEEITKNTGVELDITVAADSSQLGLMIASNDLPDLVITSAEMDRLSNPNYCYAYEDLMEEYNIAGEGFTEMQKAIGRSYSSDGKYYAIKNVFNTAEDWSKVNIAAGQGCLYYRKDIWEALGSPKMENLDDFMNVLEMVKENYPDMVPWQLGGNWKFQTLSTWIGCTGEGVYGYNEDGSVVYKTSHDKYHDFLKYANELARKGYITAEAYANEKEEDAFQVPYNGNCFAFSSYLKAGNFSQITSNCTDPDAVWEVMPSLGEGATEIGTGFVGTFISKSCSDPEAAMRLVDYLFSEEGRHLSRWGREGEEWNWVDQENGVVEFSDEYTEALNDPDLMKEKYNYYQYYGANAIDDVTPDFIAFSEENRKAALTYMEKYSVAPEIGIAKPVSSSDEGIIEAKLKEAVKAEEAKIIFTETDEEFEAAYENLQEIAKKIGVDQLNEYMTNRVKEVKEELGL